MKTCENCKCVGKIKTPIAKKTFLVETCVSCEGKGFINDCTLTFNDPNAQEHLYKCLKLISEGKDLID